MRTRRTLMAENLKGIIHEFNPVIYPFRLWIGINVPAKAIQERFYAYDMKEDAIFDITDTDPMGYNAVATTFPVVEKKGLYIGAFVNINKKHNLSLGVIAHEALHVCDLLSDRLGLVGDIKDLFIHGEARAYFVEWVANCINKVKLNKIK